MSGNTVTRLAEEKQTRPHFKELGGTLLKITPAINHGISKSLFHDMKGIFQSYVSWGSALPQPRLQPYTKFISMEHAAEGRCACFHWRCCHGSDQNYLHFKDTVQHAVFPEFKGQTDESCAAIHEMFFCFLLTVYNKCIEFCHSKQHNRCTKKRMRLDECAAPGELSKQKTQVQWRRRKTLVRGPAGCQN